MPIWGCAYHAHMGWLRLVGSIKWLVSFAEYRLFYRAFWHVGTCAQWFWRGKRAYIRRYALVDKKNPKKIEFLCPKETIIWHVNKYSDVPLVTSTRQVRIGKKVCPSKRNSQKNRNKLNFNAPKRQCLIFHFNEYQNLPSITLTRQARIDEEVCPPKKFQKKRIFFGSNTKKRGINWYYVWMSKGTCVPFYATRQMRIHKEV